MRHTAVKHDDLPSTAGEDLIAARYGDPAKFLRCFLRMMARPDRGEIGWDHEALEWISRVWGEAAIAAAGDTRLRDACVREQERYKRLELDLKHGEYERGDSGIVFLDESADWPHPKVLRGAIDALQHAEIHHV